MKRLTVEELPRLRHIGREFTKAAKRRHPFNEQYFEAIWTTLLTTNIGTIFYEEDEDKKVIAVIASVYNPDMFSGMLTAAETFWFLLPEARGQHLSVQLLDAFETEAKARGCEDILMVCLSELSPEIVGAIYTRRGYTPAEVIYLKEL